MSSGHDHGHHHHHHHDHDHSERALRAALGVTAVFFLVELIGGFWSNSLALLSDAGHMLTDLGGLLLGLFAAWVARRPASQSMSFGYHRAEILGALLSGLSIWALAGILGFEAVSRLREPAEVRGPIVLVVAAAGLLVNLFSMRLLHAEKEHSLNVRGAYLHVMADAAGSVGAILAGVLITWKGWTWVDPAVTFLLSALMLAGSWSLIRDAVAVLMESTPRGVDPARVRLALASIEQVREVHDLHIWTVGSRRLAMSVHLVSPAGEAVLMAANEILERDFGIRHTTIQVENPERFRSARCYDCS